MTVVTLGAPLTHERDAFFYNLLGLGTRFYAFGLVLLVTHVSLRAALLIRLKRDY